MYSARSAPAQPFHSLIPTAWVALAVLLITTSAALSAPKPDLWARWGHHDPASTAEIDHTDWTRLIGAYARPSTDGVTRFDYGGVRTADRGSCRSILPGWRRPRSAGSTGANSSPIG